ncbi:MAG: cell division protein ZapA [Nevskia sp.]|uniref:cell division protein ZapA n=1 Tax=Nevskia sp. TaxID=1929292 RepID=UPI00403525A0
MSRDADKPDLRTVTVRIMSREYTVTCPPDEHEGLVASADYLNERMTAIRRRGMALGAERIAVMTALNLARELLALKGDPALSRPDQEVVDKLQQMAFDIDQTLDSAD